MQRLARFADRQDSVPQFASLSAVEAALRDGALTPDYELLLSEKMVRDQDAERVLALLRERGVQVTVSNAHYGDAIASRAERRRPA